MKSINGETFNDGIACGKATVIFKNKYKYKKTSIINLDIKKEIQKFIDIKKRVVYNITNNKEVLKKNNFNESELDIFDAQIQIVNDPYLYSQMDYLISKKKFNMPHALDVVSKKIINNFKAIDNEYFKARINDITEICASFKELYYDNNLLPTNWKNKIIVKSDVTTFDVVNLKEHGAAGLIIESSVSESHALILAQQISIPIIISCNNATRRIINNEDIVIDNDLETVYYYKLSESFIEEYKEKCIHRHKYNKVIETYVNKKTITSDGYPFDINLNVNSLLDIEYVANTVNGGVGLLRSEFIFSTSNAWPEEKQQVEYYEKISDACLKNNRKAVIRTLDIGNDKSLSYFSLKKRFGDEENPVLGIRGIRFSYKEQDFFKTQIRSLLRANYKNGNIWIMLPMVICLSEIRWARRVINDCAKKLLNEGKKFNKNVKIGIMVETPLAVFNIEVFAKYVDFFSIGTNDLMQYTYAIDRLNSNVTYLWRPTNPGFIKAINHIIKVSKKNNVKCSMCGNLASNKYMIPYLIGMGLDSFSVPTNKLAQTRFIINNLNKSECDLLLKKALKAKRSTEVFRLSYDYLREKKNIVVSRKK